ncbi:MAG: diacylglycerol kinase [Bacteroidetes bacterium]|nr:MAG: diacylglycerol kinase [Bacteroidota bacterium]
MIISLIAAASTNNVIGKNNRLLWSLPNDMKYFKNTTWAMPVIMGRKTFESLDNQVLPGRFNIIVTHQKGWHDPSWKVQVADSLIKAVELARQSDCKECFIIGGGQLFAEAISKADRIYMTRVAVTLDGDAFFPPIDPSEWNLASKRDFSADEKHAFNYSFEKWERANHVKK